MRNIYAKIIEVLLKKFDIVSNFAVFLPENIKEGSHFDIRSF